MVVERQRRFGSSIQAGHEPIADINTTPLIDVMLVLLIMLIISIPVQMHGVILEMPRAASVSVSDKPDVVALKAARDGSFTWNGEVLSGRDDLSARLKSAATRVPQPEIHISADRKTKFAPVATLLAESQKAGLLRIGIVGAKDVVE